jgi:hypothetical protein
VLWIGQITADQYAFASRFFDVAGDVFRVFVLVEVRNEDVRAFTGEGDGDRAADSAVASGDNGAFPG